MTEMRRLATTTAVVLLATLTIPGAAAGQGVTVAVDVAPGLATVAANADALVRMLGTLIVRASRYAPRGASVRVTADGPLATTADELGIAYRVKESHSA